mgnify:CR=1 FL=1
MIEKIVDSTTGEVTYNGERKELYQVASHETIEYMKKLTAFIITVSLIVSIFAILAVDVSADDFDDSDE